MNKATKGAIAAGAAGILLAGGAGTFAVWSDTTKIDAGAISTGQLNFVADAGVWSEDLDTFEIVPGDSITYTTTVTVNATGDNLTGELVIDEGTFDDAFGALGAEYVTATVDNTAVTGDGLFVDVNDENLMTFIESDTEYTFEVTITIDFDGETPLQHDQNLVLTLPALALSLNQKA